MPRRRKSRVYWRTQGGESRAYGDFRDLGGGREALRPDRNSPATTDPSIAEKLAADRVAELQAEKRDAVLFGISRKETMQSFTAYHLVQKAKTGAVTEQHLAATQQRLDTAISFFGADRDLSSIGVRDAQRFTNWLLEQPNGRKAGGTFSASNVRQYLVALSNLYRRAQSESCVPPGFNPVAAMMEKPKPRRAEARWLEVHDAALLLESARTWKGGERAGAGMGKMMYPLLATFLLTGGREREVLGLEVEDVSFDRKTVTFRPNRWRRLKTRTSHRTIPLWPQLEEILRVYMYGGDSPRVSGLLFPSVRQARKKPKDGEQPKPDEQVMVRDVRKQLDAIAERAGWKEGEIRSKMFRHTYCSARIQTLDNGAPVSIFTVGRELGHGGDSLVRAVYGHLGTIRHRSGVVEYRAEQAAQSIGDEQARQLYAERLKRVQAQTV
jgi:integrase